ncbi:2-haloalkanoic acid dehalogenase [Phlyctema vagabunda]|uniref:2-haloalkanoic acid dehalogenase n=1 Tax=Phlyctema vagabunda TaxID=108571 RepID=A0ABR4P5G8_9HELO
MTTIKKHAVFDVVGTCVSYDNFFDAIESRLGERLRAECIKPKLLGFAWMECAEREYTYLSMSGKYMPFWEVFKPLFYRILWMAGIQEPRKFATDEDGAFIVAEYRKLKTRPGIHECFAKLRAAGFTVWALTAGDKERVLGYFRDNGLEMPEENFITCDTLGVGKPAPGAYSPILDQFGTEEAWFCAAHMWDASAAKRAGFKGAWAAVWEKEANPELFGEIDVTAETLPEMADKVIAASVS